MGRHGRGDGRRQEQDDERRVLIGFADGARGAAVLADAEPQADDAGGVEDRDDVGEQRAVQQALDHLHPILDGLHAEQEHEEEDVVVDEPGLELDAARDQVVIRDTG